MSSWVSRNGIHDFNKIPLAPPGTKVIVHSKPSKRASWAYHGVNGWYIGGSYEHYRCVRCYIPSTRSEISCDTVTFIPSYVPIPETCIDDHIKKSSEDWTQLLYSKTPIQPAITSNNTKEALIQISQLLNRDSAIIKQLPNATSEGGVVTLKNNKCDNKAKQKPMADEEFNALLQSIKKSEAFNIHPTPKAQSTYTSISLPTTRQSIITPNSIGRPRLQKYQHGILSKSDIARNLLAQNMIQINHIFDANGKAMSIDTLLKSENAIIWENALSNELGRLVQGINSIIGNDALDFILKSDVPKNKIVTYARMVCEIRPFKNEQFRV